MHSCNLHGESVSLYTNLSWCIPLNDVTLGTLWLKLYARNMQLNSINFHKLFYQYQISICAFSYIIIGQRWPIKLPTGAIHPPHSTTTHHSSATVRHLFVIHLMMEHVPCGLSLQSAHIITRNNFNNTGKI